MLENTYLQIHKQSLVEKQKKKHLLISSICDELCIPCDFLLMLFPVQWFQSQNSNLKCT